MFSVTILALVFYAEWTKRGKKIPSFLPPLQVRALPGAEAMQEIVGRCAELNRPIHFTVGGYGLTPGDFAIKNLPGLAVLGYLSEVAGKYNVPVIATTKSGEMQPIQEAIEKDSYIAAGNKTLQPDSRYITDGIFSYTAGVLGILTREHVGAQIAVGLMDANAIMLFETAAAQGAMQIAGTDATPQIAIAIASCDFVLVGDEVYALSAKLRNEPTLLGPVVSEDIIKYLLVALTLVGAVMATLGNKLLIDLLAL